jgi:hypothetical protein
MFDTQFISRLFNKYVSIIIINSFIHCYSSNFKSDVRAELVKNKHIAPVWLSSVDETLCEGLPTLSDAAMQVKLARGNCLRVCVCIIIQLLYYSTTTRATSDTPISTVP